MSADSRTGQIRSDWMNIGNNLHGIIYYLTVDFLTEFLKFSIGRSIAR
jgi:hypothetical protein